MAPGHTLAESKSMSPLRLHWECNQAVMKQIHRVESRAGEARCALHITEQLARHCLLQQLDAWMVVVGVEVEASFMF